MRASTFVLKSRRTLAQAGAFQTNTSLPARCSRLSRGFRTRDPSAAWQVSDANIGEALAEARVAARGDVVQHRREFLAGRELQRRMVYRPAGRAAEARVTPATTSPRPATGAGRADGRSARRPPGTRVLMMLGWARKDQHLREAGAEPDARRRRSCRSRRAPAAALGSRAGRKSASVFTLGDNAPDLRRSRGVRARQNSTPSSSTPPPSSRRRADGSWSRSPPPAPHDTGL
jgi:hypothetical protein